MNDRMQGFVAGLIFSVCIFWMIWGASYFVGFVISAFQLGFKDATTFVPSLLAGIAVAAIFGGLSFYLVSLGVERLSKSIDLSIPRAAIEGTIKQAQKPETWFLLLSGAFAVLTATKEDLKDDANGVKLIIYVLLAMIVTFTFCFIRRSNRAYKIGAVVGPLLWLALLGIMFVSFGPGLHVGWSDSAYEVGRFMADEVEHPQHLLLLLMPIPIAISGFLSVMSETAAAKKD